MILRGWGGMVTESNCTHLILSLDFFQTDNVLLVSFINK